MVPPVSQRRDLSLWRIGATLAALLALPRRAEAAGPLPGPGERIQTSDYSLDLFQGPVLAGSRITGLAGAYSALAEGAEGHSFNAAAPVVRTPYSMRRTDWDATASMIAVWERDGQRVLARLQYQGDEAVGIRFDVE